MRANVVSGPGHVVGEARPVRRPRWQTRALTVAVLMYVSLLGAGTILMPLYLHAVSQQDTFIVGMALLPGGVILAALSRPAGSLFDRVGARPLVVPGTIAIAAALWVLAGSDPAPPLLAVVGIHTLLMFGVGLVMTPILTEALQVLPERLQSHGSAIISCLQQVAGSFGTAGFVFLAARGANTNGILLLGSLRHAFAVAGAVALLSVVAALFLRKPRTREKVRGAR